MGMGPTMNNQKVVFVQDSHRDRARRSERVARFKAMGFKVVPARDFDLSLQRCLRHDFDLVMVHEGNSLPKAIEMCEALLKQKPHQALMLVTDAQVQQPYAVGDDLGKIEQRARELTKFESSELIAA